MSASTVVVDLRSDTLTKPNEEMRRLMASAEVGDDVFDEDPTVHQLEAHVAELTGKQRALWVPTGTMGNLICVMAHCPGRMDEIIVGDNAHQCLYEVGNISTVAGVHSRQIPTNADGTLSIADIAAAVRVPDSHAPITRAVLLENTHNKRGGRILPIAYCWEVKRLCESKGIALHCDGARIWNAAVGLNVPLADVAAPFDSISLCLSKALGAPMGSVIVGTNEFVLRCRHIRKMLGGGTRQCGIVAAAGLYAVDVMYKRLHEDHEEAAKLGAALVAAGATTLQVQSNICIWQIPNGRAQEVVDACKARGVLLSSMGPGLCRAIPHYGNSAADIQAATGVIVAVMKELHLVA